MQDTLITIYILSLVLFVIEKVYKPRLDYTKDGKLLLWVNGKNKREPLKIFK